MASQALTIQSRPHSQRCEDKADLIRLWIGKLALNAGQALTPTSAGVFEALWNEGFEDLPYGVLEQAFRRTLQTCKYWPVKVSDVREHVSRTEQVASIVEADSKWEHVLEYIRLYFNPDLPGGASRGAPRITERTMTAIRAAGGLAWIADCPRDQLVWARKAFCESYSAWETLQRDQYLLPDSSPVKALINGISEIKTLQLK
jgi:hypothetical protein